MPGSVVRAALTVGVHMYARVRACARACVLTCVCGMRARGYYINKQSVNEQTETDIQYFRGRNNMVRPGAGRNTNSW